MFTRQLCINFVLLFIAGTTTRSDAFSVPTSRAAVSASVSASTTKLFMSENAAVETATEEAEEETVMMRSLNFEIQSKPLGIVLEEIESGGVYCLECDLDGAAYIAGIREGDVLAALDGNEQIFTSTLDDAMTLLGATTLPIPIKVYRQFDFTQAAADTGGDSGTVVKMAPRRLPSAKKLVKASTNANFWKDPLMIGSAVLTVAMPLGIFVLSSGSKGM